MLFPAYNEIQNIKESCNPLRIALVYHTIFWLAKVVPYKCGNFQRPNPRFNIEKGCAGAQQAPMKPDETKWWNAFFHSHGKLTIDAECGKNIICMSKSIAFFNNTLKTDGICFCWGGHTINY